MRRLIVSNIVSADGYYEGPGKDVAGLPFDGGFSAYNAERLRAADTLLVGGTSFAYFRDYWPAVADAPEAPPVERAIARMNNAIEKVAISDRLTAADTAPWDSARIVGRADAHAAIADLKRRAGKDILVFGSRTLWNALLAAGLVDELHLLVGPRLLGAGTPVFSGHPPATLRLLEARTLPESQLVLLRYSAGPTVGVY